MKSIAIICLSLFSTIFASAQLIPNYTFSQSTGIYNVLSSPTVLAQGSSYDNERFNVSLPFTFVMDNISHSNVYISMNGLIGLNADPGPGYWQIGNVSNGYQVISGFDYDLGGIDATSQLSYKTLGTAPNRIFVAQWHHMGIPGFTALHANFQIRLFETSNNIQVIYDTITLNVASTISVQLGLRGLSSSNFTCRKSTTSSWNATSLGNFNTDNITYMGGSNPAVGQTYLFTAPPVCSVPVAPSNLLLTPGLSTINVSFTPPSPAASFYLVVRTPNTPLSANPVDGTSYTLGTTLGNGIVVSNTSSSSINQTGLPQNTSYTYTVFSANSGTCFGSPKYNLFGSISASTTTLGPKRYVWLPTSGTHDFNVATNWLPARTILHAQDTLEFSSGGSSDIQLVPSQTIAQLIVKTNTAVNFQAASNAVLTVSNKLLVNYGNTLALSGTNPMKIAFASGSQVNLEGTLSLSGKSVFDVVSTTTSVSGTVNVNSNQSIFYSSCSTCTPAIIEFTAGSNLNLNRDSVHIPFAKYHVNSTIRLNGITNYAPTMYSSSTEVGNLIVNCPLNTINFSLPNSLDKIKGNFTIQKTGIGQLSCSSLHIEGITALHHGKLSFYSVVFHNDVILDTGTVSISQCNFYRNLTSTIHDTVSVSGVSSGITFNGITSQVFQSFGVFNLQSNATLVLNNSEGVQFSGAIHLIDFAEVALYNGHFTGTGIMDYGINSSLLAAYNMETTLTSTEWPVVNGPKYFNVNLTGTSPNNRLHLPGDRRIPYTLDMTNGVILLDNNNLFLGQPGWVNPWTNVSATNMVATNGTGKLWVYMLAGNYQQLFPLGDITGMEEPSRVILKVSNNPVNHYVGIGVKNLPHPNAIGVSPLQRYWIIEDTSFVNYNYSLQLEGSATDNFDINQKLKSWNGSSWTTYPGNVYGTMLVSDSNLSTLVYPLHNRELTGLYDTLNSVQNTYVWNGSVNQDYQVAANWTPSRTNPSPFDALVFNNGLQDTVNNIPSQTIRKLSVLNNTVLHFVPSTSYIIYTIQSDNNSTNHELNIEVGSAFMIQGDYFELKFAGNNNTALVSGRLEINDNTAATAKVNFTNCIATVSATGVLAAGGTVGLNPFVSTNTTLKVFGIYENKYTNNVGFYPVATWEDGSEVKVLGLLNPPSTASGSTSGFNQEFYNYTFNCVNLSSSFSFGNLTIDSVRNKFSILSTGSSYISMDTVNTKKFFMSNGQFRPQTVFVQDSLNYSGGQIINPFTSSRFIFNGQQGIQEFSCHDSSFEGAMKYHIQNPNGIHLSGTGAFSTNPSFKIYSGGSIEVNTAATTPISTNLILTYDSVNTTLSYLYKGNLLSDAICYPSLNSPSRLTIDIGNLHHIQLPFSRTIRETLTMTSGNIRLGAFDLTLGKSVTATGSLSYTSGFIESTTGYFYRWYKTTGLSTGAILAYPMGDGSSARKVYMYFSSSTALSTGGTIGVRHTNPGGNTNGLSIADASFIISNRTNANWEFVAGNGITATGTIGLKFEAYGLNLFGTPADNRITQATAVVGGHVNGSGVMPDVEVQRNNINLAALTAGPFYVGFAGLSSSNLVYSVSSGNWNDPTIWNINAVPNASHVVYISSGTHVAVTTTQAAYNVTVLDGGVLSCISDTIHVEGTITNKGQFLIQGGNVIQGYSGGGDRDFINLDSLSITSGYLEINGMIQSAATFIQTGGVILVDGNSGLSFGNETSHLVQITGNVLATGGLLIIRDPHYYSSGAVFNGGGFDVGHTIQLGDGISNTGGSSGFSFATQGNGVGNLHVLASGVGLNREVNIYAATIVKGNLSLLNPSAVLDCAANLTIGGNLYIDTGAVWYTGNLVTFGLAGSSAIQTQELLSYGSIVNYFSTTNFIGIKFDNISTEGIRCKLGNWSYSGTMNLGNTKLTMEDNTVITGLNSSPTYANGWIHGKLKLNCSTTTTTLNFPIGDSLFASPVSINLNGVVSQSTTTPGYIQMHTLPMDHPLLSSSTINPGASVNRNYVIDTSGGLLFNSGQAQLNFKYNVSDIDAGANVSNFIVAKMQGGNWTNYLSFNPSLYTLSTVLDLNHLEGEYNIGENAQMPIILGQPVDVMVCSNDNAQMVVNASATNSFQWEVNDGSGWIALIASLNYSGTNTNTLQLTNCTTSMNGYLYRCKISNNIGSVYSSIVSLSVGIAFAPVLTISPTTNTLCANDTVTFSTSLTNGGAAPSYDWFINGVSQNLNSPYALFSGLTTNSIIYCTVLSNSTCALPGVVTSNSETITVNPLLNASITISSSLGNSICVGATDTFTALILNGGSDPHYQWKKNGVNVGTDSPIYISNSLGNGNTITCQLTSNENCINSAVVQSNTITMTVSSPVTPNVTISANPGTTICAGTGVTFTAFATNGGSTPQFQWYLNGSLVGTNSNTYTNGGLQNSDQVSCVLVSSVGCVTSTSDTSNILSMVVNPILTPDVTISVNPSDTLCIGSTAIFSSLVTNAGSTISYSWKKNGITVSTSSSYSSSTLANGDEIKLVINTTPQCASTTTDTSNTISMTMVGNVTPSITISNPQGSVICSGDTVVFTANAVNGGSSPIFQWTKNGVNVGSNSNVYSDVGFVNGDLIQCILTSSASCATIVNVSSNTIALTVNPIVTPNIAISASPGNSFCEGANVTFNASITNGGSTPVYSWKKNGIVVGSNMPSYTSSTLANGDIISCTLNSNANCVSANNINSNDILVNVISNTTPSVSITANPGTSITSGQLVTFTATASNAGSTPSYQWKINSVNVGTNSSTYTSSTLMNTDLVQCVVTSSDTCVTSPVASSNNLIMNVSVGVNDVLAWYELPTLYPNPASKVVNLKGKLRTTNHVTLTCNLISSIGQVVIQSRYELSTSTFDIAVPIPQNVSPGIYLVKLQVDKQEFLYRLVVN